MFLYKSDRSFVVFSYSASHGLLLLRSRKSNQHSTRVDILIEDVRAMEARSWFNGIEIEEVDPSHLDDRGGKPLEMMEPGNKAYSIRGNDWWGYINGGIARTHEDDGEFMEESKLL
jgi:hypothetical protein